MVGWRRDGTGSAATDDETPVGVGLGGRADRPRWRRHLHHHPRDEEAQSADARTRHAQSVARLSLLTREHRLGQQRTAACRVRSSRARCRAAIGDRASSVELVGYGRIGWSENDEAVSPDSTRYDLASLTKAVATTSATLLLVQDGRIRLDDPVQRWLPEFKGRWTERVTWRHLLTHTAGLPVGAKVRGSSSSQRLHNVIQTELMSRPDTRSHIQMSASSFSGKRPSVWQANRCRRFSSAGYGARWACDRPGSGRERRATTARQRCRNRSSTAENRPIRSRAKSACRPGTQGSFRRATIWRGSLR
jgi:hypothetical protein